MPKNRKLTLYDKQEIDRKVFEECLFVNDNQSFDRLMNFTFNDILIKLRKVNPDLSRNELMYCCFVLLGLSNQEIILILDMQISSIYKLKQRLAQKLNLETSTNTLSFLKSLWLN